MISAKPAATRSDADKAILTGQAEALDRVNAMRATANGHVTKMTKTTKDANGNTTVETTEYELDDEGYITNTKTSTTTGKTVPGEEGNFDPHNAACQALMGLEVMPGGGRMKFFTDMFNRPYKEDPRTVHKPTPPNGSECKASLERRSE